MSCPYYWYNYHYACRKSGKDVNEDTYDRYCKNYSYGDCPIYKGNDESGCFLTSACVEAKGLPDNCYELTVLRNFRDNYLRNSESGASEVCQYYHIAPPIVEKIKQQSNALEMFEHIYTDLVQPCVKLIEQEEHGKAHALYRSYVVYLQTRFL